jgi:hypothetical protein
MRLPVMQGLIDRRILVNYRVAPEVMAAQLPAPFVPKLFEGHAIAGICLIRLKEVRPRSWPAALGICSENAAHRVAVEWQSQGVRREGVYVRRRDSDSRLNVLAGGRVFPGIHHHAAFQVSETDEHIRIDMASDDLQVRVRVHAREHDSLPAGSIFPSLHEASEFFRRDAMGYSDTHEPDRFDGMELRCREWHVTPLQVDEVASSYFDDKTLFPEGSVTFDCALLMRGIAHEWHSLGDLCCARPGV